MWSYELFRQTDREETRRIPQYFPDTELGSLFIFYIEYEKALQLKYGKISWKDPSKL